MPELRFRAGCQTDVPAVLRFWELAAEDAHRPSDSGNAVQRLIERDPEALLLACSGDDLVGTIVGGWDGWRFHLYRLAVHPDHRREGIAQQLLARTEERFSANGATRADAMVLNENGAAHGFWDAHGYAPQGEWRRWVKPLE